MCFSAEVSFGAAAVLGVTGIAALRKVKGQDEVMFAAIPLIFAIQQACEGILWLSMLHGQMSHLQKPFTYIFLFFAQFLWTIWIPISFLLLERNKILRKLLLVTAIAGVCDSLLLGYRLIAFGAKADIDCSHISYNIPSPHWMVIMSSVLYVIAIIFTPLFSSLRHSRLLGTLMAGSLLFTKLMYEHYLISVWCFFAALLSVMILRMMRQFHEETVQKPVNGSVSDLRHQH